ncbi:MAG: hypothetical protein Q9180_007414 [Flavoplaca navasiana]
MSSKPAEVPRYEKRELEVGATPGLTALPTSKRQKLKHRQENFPPSFWDNLSQLYLTTRSLREFDRRTVWPSTPKQPDLTGAAQIDSNQLVQFAKEGGPDLKDLRGFQCSGIEQSDLDREAMPKQKSTAPKTSAYDPQFEQHLIDHGCYPMYYPSAAASFAARPKNFAAILASLQKPTTSSSALTEQQFHKFLDRNRVAATESETMSGEIRNLAGEKHDSARENVLFNNLVGLIMDKKGEESTLSGPRVDSYEGNSPTDLDASIRESLSAYIVPSSDTTRPCLPNFFLEAKGKKGDSDVVMRQAWHDGCLGARGVHELRAWIDPDTLEDNNAYTLACTYEPGNATLIVYTIHPHISNNKNHRRISSMPNRHYEYIMSQLDVVNMRKSPASFIEGMRLYENARLWAKEQRDDLYAAANLKAKSKEPAFAGSGSQESSDELGMDGASG